MIIGMFVNPFLAVLVALCLAPTAWAQLGAPTTYSEYQLPVLTTGVDPTPVTEPAWIVRAVFNNGYTTPNKMCTEKDFAVVADAVIATGIKAPTPIYRQRQLRADSRTQQDSRRKLGHNCSHACKGLPKFTCMSMAAGGTSCYSYAYNSCGTICQRRKLEEEEAAASKFIVLDDIFDDDSTGGDDGRKLNTAHGISESKCNKAKLKVVMVVLSTLAQLSVPCASLLLSPSNLQCLVVTAAEE
jgi:hypothetical protein